MRYPLVVVRDVAALSGPAFTPQLCHVYISGGIVERVVPAADEPSCEGRAVVDGKDHVLIPCFTNLHLETSGIPLDELEAVLTEALDESWRCGVTTTVVLADDDCAARRIQALKQRLDFDMELRVLARGSSACSVSDGVCDGLVVSRRSEDAAVAQPGVLVVHDCEGADRFRSAHAAAYAVRASCGHSSAYPVVRDAAAGLGAMRRAAAAGVALADGCVESVDVLAELRAFAKAGTCDDAALCDLLSLLTVDAHALLGMEKRAVIEQGSVADMMLLRRPRRCARRAGAVLSLRSVLAGVSTDAVVAIFKREHMHAVVREKLIPMRLCAPAAAPAAGLSRVELAIAAVRAGGIIVVADDEDRENEGDLIMAGDYITPEAMAFFVQHTSGVVCAPIAGEICDRLRLPPMVEQNTEKHATAFTVSIDYRVGTTTGISAHDRAATIAALCDARTRPEDFNRPGHIFPLRARPGGVLERTGHTEASVDFARLAGCSAVGVICELVASDGTGRMARRDDLVAFAQTHSLVYVTIAELVDYLKARPLPPLA